MIDLTSNMKYFSRSNQYRASNVYYDVENEAAFSYNWWQFVKRIEGKLVFNNNNYSVSTCKHLNKVRGLLSDLGVKIDIEVSTRKGLQDINTLKELLPFLTTQLNEYTTKALKSRKYKELWTGQASQVQSYINAIEVQPCL